MTKLKNRGFVLLEVILAFGVSLIIITGMIALGVSTVRATTSNKAYAEAGKIAQREVERLKLLRDTSASWAAFTSSVSGCGTSCHLSPSGSSYTVSTGAGTEGTSPSTITYSFSTSLSSDGNELNYIVTTSWTVGTVVKNYVIAGALSDWGEN